MDSDYPPETEGCRTQYNEHVRLYYGRLAAQYMVKIVAIHWGIRCAAFDQRNPLEMRLQALERYERIMGETDPDEVGMLRDLIESDLRREADIEHTLQVFLQQSRRPE